VVGIHLASSSAADAIVRPVYVMESGPAAGVLAANYIARRLGLPNIITLDVGGTTAKASLIEDGRVAYSPEYEVGASLSAGWNFNQGGFTGNPYVRVEYVDAKVNGFTESGSPDDALIISEQRVKATTLSLGAQASYAISTSWGVLLPYGKVEFQYLAQSNAQNVTAQLVGITNPASIIPKLGQDKTFGNFAAGASAILPNGFSCFFNYEQLFGKENFKDQRYTIGLRIEL